MVASMERYQISLRRGRRGGIDHDHEGNYNISGLTPVTQEPVRDVYTGQGRVVLVSVVHL